MVIPLEIETSPLEKLKIAEGVRRRGRAESVRPSGPGPTIEDRRRRGSAARLPRSIVPRDFDRDRVRPRCWRSLLRSTARSVPLTSVSAVLRHRKGERGARAGRQEDRGEHDEQGKRGRRADEAHGRGSLRGDVGRRQPALCRRPRRRRRRASSANAPGPARRPSSRPSEVTRQPSIPQGTTHSNGCRSLLTLIARPWVVTPRLTWTPIEPILRVADPDPGQALDRPGLARRARRARRSRPAPAPARTRARRRRRASARRSGRRPAAPARGR